MAHSVSKPILLTDPGMLWIAPLATAEPTNTVAAGKFTDDPPVAFIPLGATSEGTQLSNQVNVEPVTVAEFFDPIQYATTERSGSIAFALASFTLSNYRRAINGGIAALTPSGATGSELTTLEPPDPGEEVRAMILWESTDATLRLLLRQTIQGGEVQSSFQKAPEKALIPVTFNMEVPDVGKPWTMWGAGTSRV